MLLPEEQVDTIVPVKPRRCRRCAAPLHGVDATPGRHQVTELPLLRPHVTEYQVHTLACAQCGATTTAALPAGVPRGAFGPQVHATVAVCTGVYHLSRRTAAGLMADLFGVELAVGTVSACEQAVSAAVEFPGAITALWAEAKGDTAIVIARNRETGSYEAFRLALSCGQ